MIKGCSQYVSQVLWEGVGENGSWCSLIELKKDVWKKKIIGTHPFWHLGKITLCGFFPLCVLVSCSSLKSITFYLKWKHNRKQEFVWEEKLRVLLFLGIIRRTSVQTVWNAAWVKAKVKEGKTLFSWMAALAFLCQSTQLSSSKPMLWGRLYTGNLFPVKQFHEQNSALVSH